MKKIPTLFKKQYDEKGKYLGVINELTDSYFSVVTDGRAIATLKVDGSACMIKDNELYKRYDVKPGKDIPEGAIPCQKIADAITGHFPCWVKVNPDNSADKWFIKAYELYISEMKLFAPDVNLNGTFEAYGKHFNGNPYNIEYDTLYRHGSIYEHIKDYSYEGLKKYLEEHYIEGIVFWWNDEPLCKIRRKDFGFWWNKKECRRCDNGNIL